MSAKQFDQALAYEETAHHQNLIGHQLIDTLDPQRGSKILDLGCGTGFLSEVLAHVVGSDGQVVAVDPDMERLEIATTKHAASNLQYCKGNAYEIPGMEYDSIFSNYVLHWVRDKDLTFKQVSGVLKKGGKFAFVCTISSQLVDIMSEDTHSRTFIRRAKECIHFTSPDEFNQLAISNGFAVNKWEQFVTQFDFNDASDLKSCYMTHFHELDATAHIDSEALSKKFGHGKIELQMKSVLFLLTKK